MNNFIESKAQVKLWASRANSQMTVTVIVSKECNLFVFHKWIMSCDPCHTLLHYFVPPGSFLPSFHGDFMLYFKTKFRLKSFWLVCCVFSFAQSIREVFQTKINRNQQTLNLQLKFISWKYHTYAQVDMIGFILTWGKYF